MKEQNKLNLFEKIQAVSQKIMNIEKNLTVGSGSYAYKAVQDQDVILAVKEAENEFRLVSIPIKQDLISHEVQKTIDKNGNEKLTFVDNVKMVLRIIDLDDTSQFIDIESLGKGIDNGDKGLGKASTYSRKYGLLNAYKIATGNDPDANKSETIQPKATISEKRVAVENYLNLNLNTLQEMLKHFSVGTLDDLTDKQINVIFETYTKKGLI